MRHLTREIYEKMQVRGLFPIRTEDKQKWLKDWENFYNCCHYKNEEFNLKAFKEIPEIKEDILQGKRFTDNEVSEKLYIRMKETADEWKNACEMYKAEYESIKNKLPVNMQELTTLNSLHDANIIAAYKTSEDSTTIELDIGGKLRLTFTGTESTEISEINNPNLLDFSYCIDGEKY